MAVRRNPDAASRAMLAEWRDHILSRRAFLLRMAGASLSTLMPMSVLGADGPDVEQRWRLIGAVQDHLFPSEPESPGAREIRAQEYLRFVVEDKGLDVEERQFILRGAGWLEDLSQGDTGRSFLQLDAEERERLLRKIAASTAGENWLSTLQLYICEALLADPVYGGNPEGIGWKWLGHNPGFPRPTPANRYKVA